MTSTELEKLMSSPNLYDYITKEFNKIREALQKFKIWEKKEVDIYLQGSHKNHTSLGRDSDIDIVVFTDVTFRSNVKCKINSTLKSEKLDINLLW
ncbi:nucleotidyltransferase domain-containing protein [Spiroplasma floricola]|uniref:Polymerase nucleotidyl transferase domain-containing protein n=1 Tax=Spiroplasma floricola 23-6 TaxID=1336749 RepID=A0A2K8SCS8_9MOLU|nr:nucleotidyltransferase domain-containing protein [Spiroplasma floricola]AUB31252.1 hypothetical protein SFLOR_v1c01910 [Spiroplasma floricola 23-6]